MEHCVDLDNDNITVGMGCHDNVTDNSFDQGDELDLTTLIELINYGVLTPPIVLFGIVSNAVNLVVFLKIGFEKTINISLSCLAVSDLLSLACLQAPYIFWSSWLDQAAGLETSAWTTHFYEIFMPLHDCFIRVTGLVTAYIAFERCVCITMPLKVHSLITHRKTLLVMVAIFGSAISVSVPAVCCSFLTYVFYPALNTTVLHVDWVGDWWVRYRVYYTFHNIAGYTSLIVSTTCTVFLIKALKTKKTWKERTETSLENLSRSSANAGRRDRRAALTVVIITALFIITSSPILLLYIGVLIDYRFDIGEPLEYLYRSVSSFAIILTSLNSSVNIFIYICMSSKFRSVCFEQIRKSRQVPKTLK